MRDTDEVEAIVTQAARLPAVASACGTAPRFFPHTTTAAFAQMAEPPPQIVDSDAAQERHARLHEQCGEDRAVMNLSLTIEDATACRLDPAIVTDIWRRALAAYQDHDTDDAA